MKTLVSILCVFATLSNAWAGGSLTIAASSGDNIDYGSATNLDNIPQGTSMIWTKLSSVANGLGCPFDKGAFGSDIGVRCFKRGADGTSMNCQVNRATSDYQTQTPTAYLDTTAWMFLAYTWDISGNTVPKLYKGTATSAVVLSTSGAVGSGAQLDDSAYSLEVGNNDDTNADAWPGSIAFFAQYNKVLTLAELQEQQYHPYVSTGCVVWSYYGAGLGTQIDRSGTGNNGTITTATDGADSAPISMTGGDI